MNYDRDLIDTIKAHFARKSSAQLHEIVQANDPDRWSPESVVAANEILRDRGVGRAQEPQLAEEERPPPPTPPDPYSLAFLALGLFGGLSGHLHFHVHRGNYAGDCDADPDLPVPFGPQIAWLALDTTDTQAVAIALELQEVQASTWAEGVDSAYQSSVFVTPPLADWTLALGRALFPPERAEAFVKPLLERLSLQFGDAQYYCTHSDVGLHLWARARQGQLVRGYGWIREEGLTLWDEGAPTKEECDLQLRFVDGRSPKGVPPDENSVMQLASLWSIDPTSLDGEFKEPRMGLRGRISGAVGKSRMKRCT